MIHVVTAANRALYSVQLDEMHRLRWDFFVEQRGWNDLRAIQTQVGFERDEFDDERAVYLLAIGEDGVLQGSMRLRPADDRSIVGDICPGAVDSAVKQAFDADTWEITRTMRAPQFAGPEGKLRLKLTCGACEFAIAEGIRRYVCCVDTFLLPSMRALNREKHSVLGLPVTYPEGEMVAVELRPDLEWLDRTRPLAGLAGPVLVRRGLIPVTVDASSAAA